MASFKGPGRITSNKKLAKFEKYGNQIVVHWGDSRPDVLTWSGFSWVDSQRIGYAIDAVYQEVYKVAKHG